MIRIRCTTCVATTHVGDDGALPLGWGLTDEGGHQCPRCGDDLAVLATAHDVALRMPRGPVTRARLWVQPFPASPCPDCGEPVRRGLGCFCRPGDRP